MGPRNDALLDWYGRHRRDLPWRETRDPYRILVSEVMLQQTQVTRVVGRYERFLDRFPTEAALADATLGDVLAEWSGLGYNRRAVNLQACAARVADQGWPRTVDGLQQLPGVGPYTAAAVASIAFGADVAAIDTNLRRVISRWEGRALDGAPLRDAALPLVPSDRAADWNQAIMDLGATLCRPVDPACSRCPVEPWCADPGVVSSPPRQPRFKGSNREARGAVIRELTASAHTLTEISARSGIALGRVRPAAAQLLGEGLIEAEGDTYRLGSTAPDPGPDGRQGA